MDRQEEVGAQRIGTLDALHQPLPCRTFGDQEHAALEPRVKQLLLDARRKVQIESKLGDAARASRARRLRRVPDVDHDPESRAPAGIRWPGFGPRRMRSGMGERSRNEQRQDAQQPQHDRRSPIVPLGPFRARSIAVTNIACRDTRWGDSNDL